jgi:uncharacterized protein (UPF0335 family)
MARKGKAQQEAGDVFDDTPPAAASASRDSNHTKVLRAYVERLERLNEEAAGISEAKSELMKEAKSNGFTVSEIRRVVSLRKLEADKLEVLKMYADAMGVFG